MTPEEFSNSFDVKLDSYRRSRALDGADFHDPLYFNEYEKSVFLTKAQWTILLNLYRGSMGASFEETEEVTAYLAPLVRQVTITEEYEEDEEDENARHIVSGSHLYQLPTNLLFITFESCVLDDPNLSCNGSTLRDAMVIPVTQDAFHRTYRNPFKGPNARKVLRLAFGHNNSDILFEFLDSRPRFSELVSKYNLASYTVRYIKRPSPIITADLSVDDISIEGVSSVTGCELNPAIHEMILDEAVRNAALSKMSQSASRNQR